MSEIFKLMRLIALMAFFIGVILLFFPNTNDPSQSGILSKIGITGVKDLQDHGPEERSLTHDRASVYNSELNQKRRELVKAKKILERDTAGLAILTKVNTVIQPGESLITLAPYGGNNGVLITSLTFTVVEAEDGSEVIQVSTAFIEATSRFIRENQMQSFYNGHETVDEYVEAWSGGEYEDLLKNAQNSKGTDMMTIPNQLFDSDGQPSISLEEVDDSEKLGLDITATRNADGSINVQSEFRLGK